MVQLRQDYPQFVEQDSEVIAIGQDSPNLFKRFWREYQLPYIGLADTKPSVADRYYQEVNLFKLGRMPALFIIDRSGMIRYAHYGNSMSDIPENEEVLEVLSRINEGDQNE